MTPTTPFAVAIVNFNTRELVTRCLQRLQRAEPLAEYWVLDNGSSDGSAARIREQFPAVHLLESQVNLGFAGGVNRLLRECPAPYIVLLNTDAVPEPGALTRLRDYLVAHPHVAAAGPRLVDERGHIVGCHDRFPGVLTEIGNLLGVRRPPRHDEPRSHVDWIGGACFMVSRLAVQDVGPFDADYFMYCEEMDWCRRAQRSDWRIACLPEARVVHTVGGSGGIGRRAQIFDSKIRYQRKHGSPTKAALLAGIYLAASAPLAVTSALLRGPRSQRTRSYVKAINVALSGLHG
jgi:GT2 family glycosyltransferase